MSLKTLRRFAVDLQHLIEEFQSYPPREIDIASEHNGNPALVAQILRTDGNPKGIKWYQVERIYCSAERCLSCPHGDFKYRYQRSKNGRISKKYVCTMAINNETIKWMRLTVKQGVAYELGSVSDGDEAT